MGIIITTKDGRYQKEYFSDELLVDPEKPDREFNEYHKNFEITPMEQTFLYLIILAVILLPLLIK